VILVPDSRSGKDNTRHTQSVNVTNTHTYAHTHIHTYDTPGTTLDTPTGLIPVGTGTGPGTGTVVPVQHYTATTQVSAHYLHLGRVQDASVLQPCGRSTHDVPPLAQRWPVSSDATPRHHATSPCSRNLPLLCRSSRNQPELAQLAVEEGREVHRATRR